MRLCLLLHIPISTVLCGGVYMMPICSMLIIGWCCFFFKYFFADWSCVWCGHRHTSIVSAYPEKTWLEFRPRWMATVPWCMMHQAQNNNWKSHKPHIRMTNKWWLLACITSWWYYSMTEHTQHTQWSCFRVIECHTVSDSCCWSSEATLVNSACLCAVA